MKYYMWMLVLSVLFVYGLLFVCTQDIKQIDPKGMLEILPTTVTIELILYWLFTKWIWKWKFLHPWLVVVPDLSGKWEGEIYYKWNGQEGVRQTRVEIKQSFNHILVLLSTVESNSHSVTSSFDIDDKRGICNLYYTYVNEPHVNIQDRSAIHYGTIRFYINQDNEDTLTGDYWTSRDTKGTIQLKRVRR